MTEAELKGWARFQVENRTTMVAVAAAVLALFAEKEAAVAKLVEAEDCDHSTGEDACGECRACFKVRGDAALAKLAEAERLLADAREGWDDAEAEARALREAVAWPLGQLRHMYAQLLRDKIRPQPDAAKYLLGPAIERIEAALAAGEKTR